MALISQAELEARLGRSLTNDEAATFTILNSANQSYVEKLIGSKLESVEPSTRYYDGGVQHLAIDPCTSITSVALVDEDQVVIDTIDPSDYAKEPVNRTLKTMIRSRYGKLYTGINNISVSAKFSVYEDTETLNMIKNAMLDALTSEIDQSTDVLKESIEGYSVEYAKTSTKNSLNAIKFLFPEIL